MQSLQNGSQMEFSLHNACSSNHTTLDIEGIESGRELLILPYTGCIAVHFVTK